MDINDWCNSGSQNMCWCQNYVQSGYDRICSFNGLVSGSKIPRWRVLWRKIMKERKRIFFYCSSSSSCARVHVPYDPYTYSQNFDDQDLRWTDPDNVSRSFSARFAVPSRIFEKSSGLQLI